MLPGPSSGRPGDFKPEPCGRCGHDVNAHAYDAENDFANECEVCADCDGFITDFTGRFADQRER